MEGGGWREGMEMGTVNTPCSPLKAMRLFWEGCSSVEAPGRSNSPAASSADSLPDPFSEPAMTASSDAMLDSVPRAAAGSPCPQDNPGLLSTALSPAEGLPWCKC